MPKIKMKSNSSAKKRFKLTAKGKVKRKKAFLRHNLGAKSTSAKRRLRRGGYISETQEHQIKAMLPYGTWSDDGQSAPQNATARTSEMPRAKGGFKSRHRRQRIRKHAKGFRGGRSKLWKAMVEAVHRKWRFALFHRRKKKSDFRGLWIIRINAAARALGVSYSRLIAGLSKANVKLDRKILSDLAISDPNAFQKVVEAARVA
jgi:large subunit ribosomal protein L20